MTQSWNLISVQKIIECARPASHFNLKNETSDFDYAIFGKIACLSPNFSRGFHIFSGTTIFFKGVRNLTAIS